MKLLKKNIHLKSKEIADYLVLHLRENKAFKSRSFYGESFALNLINRHGINDDEIKNILIKEYKKKDKNDSEFHHEFNNYAFSDLCRSNKNIEIKELYLPLKFKGTTCTNWTLLRSNVRIQENIDSQIAVNELTDKLKNYQLSNGLILDDVGVKSFQYHCFSAAMIYEIYLKTDKDIFLKSFTSAVEFIRKFILSNGDTLYIGRGQEQSFGIGVLIYILSAYYDITKNVDILLEIELILKFVSRFQYKSGAFPLVFTGNESEEPGNVDMEKIEFCGWYPYNNFFDYLPFMGFFLHKSFEILDMQNDDVCTIKKTFLSKSYRDSFFIKIIKNKYTAVLSIPGGYWTNDLPFPLVMSEDEFITPMLGGEQFQKSLYSENALSMPTTKMAKWSWRKYGRGFFLKNGLVWVSLFGVMYRRFSFNESNIEIKNFSLYWISSEQNFSFLSSYDLINKRTLQFKNKKITFSSIINSITDGYSAMGKLKVIKAKMNIKIRLEL